MIPLPPKSTPLSLHDALPIYSFDSRGKRDGQGIDRESDSSIKPARARRDGEDRKSTRLNSSHGYISYAVFCLKKKKQEALDVYAVSGPDKLLQVLLHRAMEHH